LQEINGQFRPIVEKTMYKVENIVAFASNSGKSTSKLTVKWFEEIFLFTAENESTLCLDSWTGQKEKFLLIPTKGLKKLKYIYYTCWSHWIFSAIRCIWI